MRNRFLSLLISCFFIRRKFLVLTVASVFCFSLTKAQDTLAPHINMSQSAYDSIIRALKKSNTVKKDTAKPAIVHDTAKQAADSGKKMKVILLSNNHGGMDASDSAKLAVERHKMDSAMRADSVILAKKYSHAAKQSKDSVKHDTARQPKKKWVPSGFIALNFGIGLPLDNYVSVGSAATGENFSLCAVFPGLVSRFGWAFKFDYGLNGINNDTYLHNISEGHGNYAFTTVSTAQNYTYYTLMMGPSFSFPYGKLTFDARMLFGLLTGTIPKTTYNVVDSGSTLNITKYQATGTGFAFSFGLDVRYHVLPYVSIMLNYDYLTSTPQFTFVSDQYNVTPLGIVAVPTQQNTVTQGFQLNNLTFGIAFNIAAKSKKQ